MKRIFDFFKQHYIFFLILVVFVSYGQMLFMYPWQDDNALFFKLAHIDEPAGYFGIGPIGNGLTKWAHTPFIPIYTLFGYATVPYFVLLLFLYLMSAFFVYKAFSIILGQTGGRTAGFLYAAGYVFSDGVWRMANSVTTSLSIIFLSLFFIGYWKFHQGKRILWYLLALAAFFLASEITIVRTHYFFIIVLLFEILFVHKKKILDSLFFGALRLAPFFYIFQNWALTASASRTGEARNFALGIFHGEFHVYYGFLSSITNLIIPDWLTGYLFIVQKWLDLTFSLHLPFLRLILLTIPAFMFFLLLGRHPKRKILLSILLALNTFWVFIFKDLFISPLLTPTMEQYFVAGLGGSLFLIGVLLFLTLLQKRVFILLVFWLLANVAIYSAYNPTFQYGTVERYLAHSFVALTGIFGLLFISLPKIGFIPKIAKVLIIVLGVGNLIHAVIYQNNILATRSFPARAFYSDLKGLMPTLKKGDILYFDVAHDVQRYYNDAVSTAQMPETTAFAWRYGIDRYDINLTTDFNELLALVTKENIPSENVHAFWYSKSGLQDTMPFITQFLDGVETVHTSVFNLSQFSETITRKGRDGTVWEQPDIEIKPQNPLISITPLEITLQIKAEIVGGEFDYPLTLQNANLTSDQRQFWGDIDLRNTALAYSKAKEYLLGNSEYNVSSEWQDKVVDNLHDGDISSLWQSERTGWGREFTFIDVTLLSVYEIGGIAWINGFSHNTPVEYYIETSLDKENWKRVKEVKLLQRIDNRDVQFITFDPINAGSVRMVITKTLNGDSPSVAEFWVVPARFAALNVRLAEQFLINPFAFVTDKESFISGISVLANKGKAQLFWQGDKNYGWQTTKQAEFDIYYDGKSRLYKINLPAGGSKITKLKISNITVPSRISLDTVSVRHPTLAEYFLVK